MRKLHFLSLFFVLILLLTSSLLITPLSAQDFGSNWQGEYFANANLSGSAAFVNSDSAINFNFGTNSPNAAFLPADNFSIRWTGFQTIADGVYDFTATADDGIRVLIDGTVVIDNFARVGDLQSTVAQVTITGNSQHLIVVEYADRGGTAAVQFQWIQTGQSGPTGTVGPTATPTSTALPPIPPGALTGTVIRASVLNVRSAPSLGAPVVGRILRRETYAVVGRDTDARWFLLQLSGMRAWAYGYYLFIDGNEFNAPITSATGVYGLPAGVPDTGVFAQARSTMRLRQSPDVASTQIGRITWGGFVPVTGRTGDNTWWQVVWKGTVGWVWAPFMKVVEGDFNNVPIVTP